MLCSQLSLSAGREDTSYLPTLAVRYSAHCYCSYLRRTTVAGAGLPARMEVRVAFSAGTAARVNTYTARNTAGSRLVTVWEKPRVRGVRWC